MARRRETLDIALAVVKGEAEPSEPYVLPRDRAVTIGRTGSIRLLDHLVSIHHARVFFDPNKQVFLVEDLGSAHGTLVDDEPIRSGEKRELHLGTQLKFGETLLRVERVARLTWVLPLTGAASGILVLGAIVLLALWLLRPDPGKEPMAWEDGVLTNEGRVTSIPINDTFRFERGLSLPLTIEAVTDYDDNGRNELWVQDGKAKRDVVFTFDDQGKWVEIGSMPPDCVIRGDNTSFPLADCKGEQWRMDPEVNRYRPVYHEGPVVWYRPSRARPQPAPDEKPKAKAKKGDPPPPPEPTPMLLDLPQDVPLKVGRFSVKDNYQLGQFLSERGVYEPVHYIICEGAFEGLRAQVLTSHGEVQELAVGCIEELRMEGQISGRPYAVALTPAGLRSLTNDVLAFYAGDPDALFLDPRWAAIEASLRGDPGYFGGTEKLVASTKNAPVQIFDSVPSLDAEIAEVHPLVEADRTITPARQAHTVTVLPGTHDYPTTGCEVLRVSAPSFDSPGWFSSATLLTVTEVGCGSPKHVLAAPFAETKTRGKVGAVEVVVDVELEKVMIGGVVRVRMSWRQG